MAEPVRAEDVEALVAQFERLGCTELHLRFEGFELHLSGDAATRSDAMPSAAQPATAPTSTPAVPTVAEPSDTVDLAAFEIVRAPYLGSFYRAPKPGESAYVELGSEVEAESDVCLIEVMKLFTAVRAGVAGRIARILAKDGAMVEAGQPLFAIERRG